MKLKAARYLLKILKDIAEQKNPAETKVVAGKTKWILPAILPGFEADEQVLPLAYHTRQPPNSTYACDHPQVTHLEIGTLLRAAPILSPRLLTAKFAMPYLSKCH